MDHKTLILLSNVFPYGKGDAFLESEIKFLAKDFHRIIVLPSILEEGIRPLPPKVELNNLLLNNGSFKVSNNEVFRFFFTKNWFWNDLFRVVNFSSFRESFFRFFTFSKLSYRKFRLLENFIESEGINKSNLVVYSYWFVSHAMAISLLKKKFREIKGVTRTHEYDLYEKNNKLLPFRKFIPNQLDKVIPISIDGVNYLKSQFGITHAKIRHFNLGVENDFVAKKDFIPNKFRLLSVAFITERKRIDLIAESLVSLAENEREIDFEWIHIGDGSEDIKQRINNLIQKLPSNFTCTFLGSLPNKEVLRFYKENVDIDAFINVSSSEGKPVSIMEAQSFGIPILATNVGGVSEIVSNENGVLLSANPSHIEVMEAIKSLKPVEKRKSKSSLSFQTWNDNYNAEKNYSEFSTFLKNLN